MSICARMEQLCNIITSFVIRYIVIIMHTLPRNVIYQQLIYVRAQGYIIYSYMCVRMPLRVYASLIRLYKCVLQFICIP